MSAAGETPTEVFYVTVRRGSGIRVKTGVLLGPYSTRDCAEHDVPAGRQLAHKADPFTAFDAFGVTRAVYGPGVTVPRGVLNGRAADAARTLAA